MTFCLLSDFSIRLTCYFTYTLIQMSVLFTLQVISSLAYHFSVTATAQSFCELLYSYRLPVGRNWSSWSGSRPELKYWGTWWWSCLCLWHCANSQEKPLLATLLFHRPTPFQFVIRIYHSTEPPRLLPFRVFKRQNSFPTGFTFFLFSFPVYISSFSAKFFQHLFYYFFTLSFSLCLLLYVLLNFNLV